MSQKHNRVETDSVDGDLFTHLVNWRSETSTEQLLVELRCGGCSTRIGFLTREWSDDPRDDGPLFVAHVQRPDRDGPAHVLTYRHLLSLSEPTVSSTCRTHRRVTFDTARLYDLAQHAIGAEVGGSVEPRKMRGTPIPA